jgi:small subunit ribosomal protein S6e
MAEFKVVISDPKTGLTIQKEVKDPAAKSFLGLKLGDSIKGETIDLKGYEFEISGGSDDCGFPMRKDVLGVSRKRILAYVGTGLRKKEKGMLRRKTVCGNTVHAKIAQINLKATKIGTDNIFGEAKTKAEKTKADREAKKKGETPPSEKKEEEKPVEAAPAPEAPKAEEAKPTSAPEEKKEEVKAEEKPAEAPKEEPKAEGKPAPEPEPETKNEEDKPTEAPKEGKK